jgi:hypothetical protein
MIVRVHLDNGSADRTYDLGKIRHPREFDAVVRGIARAMCTGGWECTVTYEDGAGKVLRTLEHPADLYDLR